MNSTTHSTPPLPSRQRGAALVIGLILLLVLTLLAISGMSTSTLELQMTGNQQFSQNAFQAAETGLDRALVSGNFTTAAPTVVAASSLPGSTDTFNSRTEFNGDNGITPVPAGGFSLGVSTGFQAYHFDITSTGASNRGATSTHTQSFYIVGPGGS
jgi:type IV pilus assembly protein PilX